jgi:uncharacterized protein
MAVFQKSSGKSKKRTKILITIIATLAVIGIATTFFLSLKDFETKDYSDPKNIPVFTAGKFVYDEDNILSDETEKTINAKSEALFSSSGATLVVASIPSLNGKDIEKVSYTFASKMAIGDQNRDDGILLIFSKADQRVRLEIGKGLEGVIPDGKAGRILDNYFVPHRSADNYDLATISTVDAVSGVLAGDIEIPDSVDKEGIPAGHMFAIFSAFGGVWAIIIFSAARSEKKMYQKWLALNPNGTKSEWRQDRGVYGGWNTYHGGPRGGFGGGGGGFGGGSSGGGFGGGGASR